MVRSFLHTVIKNVDLAQRVNVLFGEPIASKEELQRRRDARARLKELLDAKSVKYTLLDVMNDQATKEFVMLQAKCKEDDLPIVFVGGVAVGGYNELVDFQVSGRLEKALGT